MRRTVLAVGGLIGALAVVGCAAQVGTVQLGTAQSGSVRTCEAYAYQAIKQHQVVTGLPAACDGLSRAQVNQAASTAINQAAGSGPKAAWRERAGAAALWVNALLTGQVPASPGPVPVPASHPGGSRLGGVSELAVKLSALLAWLATAASGGYVLVRWLLAGGSLRRPSPAAVPRPVILGHFGFALLGLVLWIIFMVTGLTALAWTSLGILAPVSGLGMGVLALGLGSPRPPRQRDAADMTPPASAALSSSAVRGSSAVLSSSAVRGSSAAPGAATTVLIAPAAMVEPRSRPRTPVLTIAAHGLFAATTLLLVLLATIGAG